MDSISQWTRDWSIQRNLDVWFQPETTSTNTIAKQTPGKYHLYLTDHQYMGRGRGGSSWHNTRPGENLLSSWVFSLPTPPQPIASPLFGLAVYTSLKTIWPNFAFSLKAPNDVYLANKKVAGLLLEVISAGEEYHLIVGLGLNVFSHPSEVEHADHIASVAKVDVTKWFQFLDTLQTYFRSMAEISIESEIPNSFCEQLCVALNYFPLKEKVVLKVHPNGDIVTDEDVIKWFDL